MNRKRTLILTVILVILGVLVYLQFRTWRQFNWATFFAQTSSVREHPVRIILAFSLIYASYVFRAWRWKLFLKPVCEARVSKLIAPQFIGFTGLALLGRPGEFFVRPYLIARRENLTFASQAAVWLVERIFDIGAAALLLAIDIFFFVDFSEPTLSPYKRFFVLGGAFLLAIFFGLTTFAVAVRIKGPAIADITEKILGRFSAKFSASVSNKIRSFREGLNTIHDFSTFVQICVVSMVLWCVIALAYREVLHSYSSPSLLGLNIQHVLLLMGASMVGSSLQLPAVGGGSQLATISVLRYAFGIDESLSVSAGMMLWVVTFLACVPVGLSIAHREHISIRQLTAEGERTEEQKEVVKSS